MVKHINIACVIDKRENVDFLVEDAVNLQVRMDAFSITDEVTIFYDRDEIVKLRDWLNEVLEADNVNAPT